MELEPGKYEVLPMITASRTGGQLVEDVVKDWYVIV
jgi:hypothetical protein